MKLTKLAITAVRGTKGIVQKLAIVLNCSDASVYRYISQNSDELTKAAALEVIRKETGLRDSQILEKTIGVSKAIEQ